MSEYTGRHREDGVTALFPRVVDAPPVPARRGLRSLLAAALSLLTVRGAA